MTCSKIGLHKNVNSEKTKNENRWLIKFERTRVYDERIPHRTVYKSGTLEKVYSSRQ